MLIESLQHVPAGFHHEHKSKGVAIPTDIDDGKPGAYDLPPPSTAGALAPPSTTANGKPVTDGANGSVLAADDYERWVERTGWAPRFGDGSESTDAEISPADHQTWVEGKLDDKFFGGMSVIFT
jgi:hypothetical protein